MARFGLPTFAVGSPDEGFAYLAHSGRPLILFLRANLSEQRSYALCELIRNTIIPFQPYIIGYAEHLNRTEIKQLLQSGIDDTHEGLSDPSLLFERTQVALRHLSAQKEAADSISELATRNAELHEVIRQTGTMLFEEDLVNHEIHQITGSQPNITPFPLDADEQDARLITGNTAKIAEALSRPRRAIKFELLDLNGQALWLEQKTLSITHEDDIPVRRITLVNNVSEQHLRDGELRQQLSLVNHLERSLTQIVVASGIGIIEYEPEKDQLRCNTNLARMLFLDVNSAARAPKNLKGLVSGLAQTSQMQIQQLLETAQHQSETLTQDLMIRSDDGRIHNLHFSLNTRFDNDLLISGAVTDLTHQYALLTERDLALEQSKRLFEQLEQKNAERTRLFAIISHELRTPLASLHMLAENEGLADKLPQGGKMVGLIDQTLQLLTDLRAVIDPAKSEDLRPLIPTTLEAIIKQAIETIQPLLSGEKFSVTLSLDPKASDTYVIDHYAVRRALINLMKNAALHSGGDKVELSASVGIESEDHTVFYISVRDNGRGIPADKVDELFLPYMRGETEREGSGLGLMIVKQLINDIGGSIHFLPTKKGTHFILEIPLTAADLEAPKIEHTSGFTLKGARILYAEDNPTLSLLTERLIRDCEPSELVVAHDGTQALDAFIRAKGKFDILITDIFMPQMSGYDLTTELRHRGFRGQIIALTAATLGDETERIIDLGADLVVEKPLTKQKLRALIKGELKP